MKALTLTQPWADLVATGDKRVETRSWSTSYRGPIAIHAAKAIPEWVADAYLTSEYLRARYPSWAVPDLPRGAVVATALLVGIHPTEHAAQILSHGHRDELDVELELSLGDYTAGRFAWFLADIRALDDPIPARGALGLWEWDESGLPRAMAVE